MTEKKGGAEEILFFRGIIEITWEIILTTSEVFAKASDVVGKISQAVGIISQAILRDLRFCLENCPYQA